MLYPKAEGVTRSGSPSIVWSPFIVQTLRLAWTMSSNGIFASNRRARSANSRAQGVNPPWSRTIHVRVVDAERRARERSPGQRHAPLDRLAIARGDRRVAELGEQFVDEASELPLARPLLARRVGAAEVGRT